MNVFLRVSFLIVTFIMLSGCAAYYPPPSSKLEIVSTVVLPKTLSETSGLYCEANQLYSLNDSGNTPAIFKLSPDGAVLNESKLALTNVDWEAISADGTYFYIADVGNNKGHREVVSVYKVKRDNLNDIQTLRLQYSGNTPSSNRAYAHDFDAEAMVKTDDALLLFSKSWRSGITHVYKVNAEENEQTLNAFAQIRNLPGVVTGADFDKTRNLFVLTGYKSDPFGNFSTFIAQVSSDFDVVNVWPLKSFKQVEGICVDEVGDYWFSEEATEGRQATLSRAVLQ